MKKIFAVIAIVILLGGILALAGCGPKTGTFGQPITKTNSTAIGTILSQPEQFDKKTVRVEGTIVEECPAGGWFMLKDASGIIYVDLHPSEIAIPQVRGSTVAAEGTVRKEGTRVTITGKGVQIK